MKTRITALFAAGLMAMALFAGCSANTDAPVATDPLAPVTTPATTDAAITPQPTDAAAPEGIAVEGVQFDQSMQTFFGGDADAAIKAMSSMLVSAARTRQELSEDFILAGDAQDSAAAFEWNMVYHLLNDFGTNNPAITANSDGSLSVPAAELEKLFADTFGAAVASIPAVAGDVSITYDEAAKTYTVARSDAGELSYAVTGVSLSNAQSAEDDSMSAMLTITAKDASGAVTGTMLVEVYANPDSAFGYSIQSVSADSAAQ